MTIEALFAAGPRKSIEAYKRGLSELCEDIAGYRALNPGVLFWICDGTSNSHELPAWRNQPGFNSRILARDVARDFAQLAGQALLQRRDYRKCDLATRLFGGIAQKWRERLIVYLAEVKKDGKLERLLANMPQIADGAYRMQWSSTFLGGIYDEQAQTLSTINIGDSGMVVIGERLQTVGPKDVRGILFATLRRGSGLDVDVCSIPVEANWQCFKGVRGFIAASDGVAKELQMFLSQPAAALTTQSTIERIWTQMSLQSRLTYDDRAIIIGRLVPGEGRALKRARWRGMRSFLRC